MVRGRSMEPGLREGDRLLVQYAAAVHPGVRVLVRFADGTLAVKRAEGSRETRDGRPGWWVLSDNPEAVLVDCRTDAEWRFVGVADLTSLQRDVVYL